jgi:NAD(P)-dependent dehydrogenase (short-subunit alcohol dehydrogenase family)
MSLTNQVALVTGAGQGIGKASALALAEAGAHVVVADIDQQKAGTTADAISRAARALACRPMSAICSISTAWCARRCSSSARSTSCSTTPA